MRPQPGGSTLLRNCEADQMVAKVTTSLPDVEKSKSISAPRVSGWCKWKLVQRFQTLESALVLMKQLEARGQAPQLVMDGGLSVVTRRS